MKLAEPITLSPEERATIITWSTGKSYSYRLVQRSRIIRMAADGVLSQEIAKELQISRPTVQLWRQRFLSLRLTGLEKDAPRPGRNPRIQQRKINAIIEATLHTTPPNATHWSTRTMAEALNVSKDTVCRVWNQHNLKPHLVKTFKLSNDKHFMQKLQDVVGLYLNPPDKAWSYVSTRRVRSRPSTEHNLYCLCVPAFRRSKHTITNDTERQLYLLH